MSNLGPCGLHLLTKLIREQNTFGFIQAKLDASYFPEGEERSLYEVCQQHIEEYGKLPALSTMEGQGFTPPETPEPHKFYLALVDERYRFKLFGTMAKEVIKLLGDDGVDDAQKVIQERLDLAYTSASRHNLIDFAEDGWTILKQHLASKKLCDKDTLAMGWPSLDSMSGGLISGDVVSIVGRPGMGKTWLMLHAAAHMWKAGHDVLFVAMEMPKEAIVGRLSAMYCGVNSAHIKHGELSDWEEVKVYGKMITLAESESARFWVLDANLAATVPEIFALVGQLKPECVFVDGAYMLRHTNPRLDRYTRVAENVEAIKKAAHGNGVPCVCSWQFNREAEKKGKDSKVTLADIAYSDAIGQISSVVLGLFQPDDDPETLKRRKIDILKGREGETGEFHVFWDFGTMLFNEAPSAEEEAQAGFTEQDEKEI